MLKYILVACFIITLFIGCSKEDIWDYYGADYAEPIHDLQVSTLTVQPTDTAIVDSLEIDFCITHADPSNLKIDLVFRYAPIAPDPYEIIETLGVYDNDYSGGFHTFSTNYFNDKQANARWELAVYDEVADSSEGMVDSFVVRIIYK